MLASIFLVPSSGSAAAPLNYRDKMGRTVTIQIPVRRAVLLQTSDLLPVTGAWDQVVGLSRYAVEDDDLLKAAKPDLARLVASVGNAGQINVEALLQLKPDVVVTWSVNPDMVRFLEQKGVPVVAVFPETIGELYEVMRLQGRLFGREKQVESGISRMEEMFSFIRRRVAAIPLTQRKKALWLSGKPTTVSGGNTINHELMALAGLDNLGQAVMRHTYEVSQEQIVAWNPDQLFIWGHARYSAADVLNNPQWRHIKAVKEHNVFKSPKWDSWSPRLAPMALWMAATAYPEQFKDIDLTKTIDKFYRDVYGIPYSKVTQIER